MVRTIFAATPRAPVTILALFLLSVGASWMLLPPEHIAWLLDHSFLVVGTGALVLLGLAGTRVRGTPIFAKDVTGDPPVDVAIQRVPDVERGLAEAGFRPLGLVHLFIPDVLDTVVAFQVHDDARAVAEPLDLPEGPYVALTTVLEDGFAVATGWEARFLRALSDERRERSIWPPGPVVELLARHRARVAEVSAARGSPPAPPSRALLLGGERHALSEQVRTDRWTTMLGFCGVLAITFGVLLGVDRLDGVRMVGPVLGGVALTWGLFALLARLEAPLGRLAVPRRIPAAALAAL